MAVSTFQEDAAGGFHGSAPSTLRIRSTLVILSLAGAAGGAWLGSMAAPFTTEPELARILKAMGLIKASMLAAALAAVLWRFSRPVPSRIAAAYTVGASLAAGASMLIVQLAWIPTAALVFHAGAGLMILAAFFDGSRRHRTQPRTGQSQSLSASAEMPQENRSAA